MKGKNSLIVRFHPSRSPSRASMVGYKFYKVFRTSGSKEEVPRSFTHRSTPTPKGRTSFVGPTQGPSGPVGVTMGWETSTRQLPPNWSALRRTVLNRDKNTCQLQYQGCSLRATDVDHIIPGDDHNLNNLQGACSSCHSKKSAREGVLERIRRKRLAKRPRESHPGLRKPRI